MRKPLCNHHLTRCLLAFLVALIVPSVAWGQSETASVTIGETTIDVGKSANFGSGTVSLAQGTNSYTLTFNNATIGSTESVASVTWNGTDNLTVDIVGTNTLYGMLTTSGQSEVFPTLTFANTSSSSCSLRILCDDGAFSAFNKVVYDGVYLHTSTPYDYSYITPQDLSGSVISDITISSIASYPIWIGSTQITSTNSSNVLGDGKVSYENNILTLNAATVDSIATQSELTIHTVGECTIGAEGSKPLISTNTSSVSVTFSSLEAEAGAVTLINAQNYYNEFSGYYGTLSIKSGISNVCAITNSLEYYGQYDKEWILENLSEASSMRLYRLINYDLWSMSGSSSTQYNNANCQSTYPAYDPESNTINLTESFSYYGVKSGLDNLNILVGGNSNEGNWPELSYIIAADGTSGTLTIIKDEVSTDNKEPVLNLVGGSEYTGPAISGFSNITYEGFKILTDGATYDTTDKRTEDASGSALTAITFTSLTASVTTAPTAVADLTYDGTSKTLITAGEASNGELQYSTDKETYNTTLPSATNAGKYKVYYKVVGDKTNYYADSGVDSLEVTIANATMAITADNVTATYDGNAHSINITVTTPADGSATIKYGTAEGTYDLDDSPTRTEIGTTTVYYQITASNYTTITGSATITIQKAEPTVTAPNAITGLIYSGAAQTLITAGSTSDGTIQYSTDNVEYSADLPIGTNAGTYNVYYKVIGDTNHKDSVYTKNPIAVTIAQANMTDVTIANVAEQTYTGATIEPEPALTLGTGETTYTLVKGTDFTYSYANNTNVPTSSGQQETPPQPTITMTAVAEGNFTGETTKTFSITPKSLADAVIADIPDRVFKNDTITPVLTVTLDGKTLVAYEDYGVYYTDNVDVGTATAHISGIGNYTGETSKEYKITPKTTALTIAFIEEGTTYSYDGTEKIPEVTVQSGTTELTSDDYTITYSDNVNAGEATITANGKGNYEGATGTLNFTISQADISTTTIATIAEQTYTGSAITPKPDVTLGSGETAYTLIEGTDFTYSYANNTNVPASGSNDVPRVYITGKGNFTGTNNKTFKITKAAGSISYETTDVKKSYGDAAFTNTLTIVGDGSVSYASSDETVATVDANGEVTITGAGTTTITATAADGSNYSYATEVNTATYSITVAKIAPTLNSAPTATNPTYTGEPLLLVSGGEVVNGTLQYVIGTNAETAPTEGFSATVPSGTDAGTYYVWYKVVGNTNYSDTDPAVITSTIGKAGITPVVNITGWTYGATASTPAVTAESNPGSGTPTYTYKVKDADDNTYTSTVPTDAGDYTIKADVPETTNYNSGTGTADFTISKATPTINKAPAALETLVYSSQAQALITAGDVTGGEMQYSTDNETFTTTIPTGTNAGTYNIYYKVVGATNYNDIPASEVPLEVKIAQANIANVIIANIDDKTYTGEAYQPEVTVTFNDLTVPAEEYTVSYSNNTEAGEATVTLTSSNVNFAEGTKTANFTITKAAGSISYEITNVSKIVGDETFTNVLTSEGDGTVTYASNNTQVATVDAETGNVTIVGAGSATITATVTDGKNYTYDVTEATYTLTVGYQLDLKFAEGQTWATYYSKDNFLTVPDGLNAYVVTNISETTVSVTQIDYIPKEEPVLLELKDNTATTFVAQVYTSAIAQFNNLLQAGTTDIAVSNFETNVYVLYNNEFRRATSGSIPAYKGYLTTGTAIAGAHLFISDGSATNIKRIADEAEEEQWYTLDGRKLNGRPQIKGVYIRNGKKIYISKK